MTFIKVEDFYDVIKQRKSQQSLQNNIDIVYLRISFGEDFQTLSFTKVQVGYGKKNFFRCPICGRNATRLYFDNHLFRCLECCRSNPYKGIQNTTRGGDDYIGYKMERFAAKAGIGQFDYPFDYLKHPRPKGKHWSKWNKNLAIMQSLENMRTQSIFFHKIWDSKTIRSIEKGKNRFLEFPLKVLKDSLFAFEKGILSDE